MATINVSNATELSFALSVAHSGDSIELAAGNFGALSLSGKNFTSDLTIASADPSHAAVFSSVSIENSSDIHLSGLNIAYAPTAATMSWSSAVMVDSSHGVSITGGAIVGGNAVNGVAQNATAGDATDNVLGLAAARAVTIQNSSAVTLSGTDISHFDRGVVLVDATTTTIDSNNIHDLRRTAIAGSGNNLTIENNSLHDAHPWKFGDTAGQGDHADFIALWTDAGQTSPASNIVIANNTLTQGAGAPILGLWLQGDNAGFANVSITGNAIEVGNDQGITLSNVAGGTVSANTLLEPAGGTTPPLIILQSGVNNVAVSGNLVSSVVDQNSGATGNTEHNNTVVQSTDPTAGGYYSSTLLSKVASLTAAQTFTTIESGVTASAPVIVGPAVTAQTLLANLGGVAGQALIGDSNPNNLGGGAGNDTLVGNGGADTLTGGSGNDVYIVPNSLAKIVEQPNGGIDTVIAKGDHTLEANVENLVISNDNPSGWNGTGNALNNVIIGNSLNNVINGGDGNDTLDGGLGNDQILGGNGNDVLLGGGGADTLTGGTGADTFVIAQGFGNDKVTDFSQAQGDTVEVVGAYATAQVGADTVVTLATGDHMTLTGVSMASLKAGWITQVDSLFGAGPGGTTGALGVGDAVLLNQAQNAVAAAPPVVIPSPPIAGLSVNGTWMAETLTGGAGDDTINGGGGADVLVGGKGNDTYIVPNSLAKIVEQPNGGIDTVIAKGDHTLEANVENLIISNDNPSGWAGTGNELNNVITGNSLANRLDGGAGDDTINGGGGNDVILGGSGNDLLLGGPGNDTLTGGAGADAFRFGHGDGQDVITDFSYADGDRVHVADSHYTLSQVGSNTVINMGGGAEVTLLNLKLSSLHADWIVVG